MKMMHEQLNILGSSCIKVKWDDFPHFTFPWHYHREFEIVSVLKSYGTRYVGDSIESFNEGDIVLLGSNLPHYWKNHEIFYTQNPDYRVNAVVVQFSPELFSHTTLSLPEFAAIQRLLQNAQRGIRFTDQRNKTINRRLLRMLRLTGMERYLELLAILHQMASCTQYQLLAGAHFEKNKIEETDQRLSKILTYINYNYTKKISIDDIASLSGMNVTALCRFFRQKTGKTIVCHTNEMRIGFACKLLVEARLSISQIALECGFNNLSNFNKTFKSITSYTPTEYLLLIRK